MKIGFDAKRLYCNYTGLGNYSRTTVDCLANFFPQNDYYLYTPKIIHNTQTAKFLDDKMYSNFVSKHPFKAYWRTYLLTSQLQKDNIELYHGLSHELPVGIEKTKIKSIVSVHDLIFKRYPSYYARMDRFIYDIKFRSACKRADIVLAISQSTKDDIVHYYNLRPEKVEVIYQPCNPIYYLEKRGSQIDEVLKKYNLPSDFLLSVGSVEQRKNLKTLVQAYSHLSHLNSQLKDTLAVVVVGKGKAYKQETQELIRKLGLTKQFIFLDHIGHLSELSALYQQAHAVVYISKYEGFGLPVLEALASKTQVITSNISSMPEAGGQYAIYVDPEDAEELADAVKRVSKSKTPNLEGYAYAKSMFSPKRLSEQLMKVYQKIV